MPDDFSVKEMKFEGDRLSLVDTEGEKIEATLKQFNKALQNIWRNFTMEELSGAFRSAPYTVLEEITKEKMPKTVTIKNFGKFTNKEELNLYKLVKEGIEYYFNAENKEELLHLNGIGLPFCKVWVIPWKDWPLPGKSSAFPVFPDPAFVS